ncbi:MAG: DNA integrity scanning diadenylate cyclase DisA [Actinomycetota bacterium]|nr:DNA integrity scanning diadenylate cyclase DisA [Actinomycetota bacterium]
MDAVPAPLLEVLRRLAPGTPLRDAVERILQQGKGGLVILGSGPEVEAVCSGGFLLEDAPFTPQRLAELAKMDGAIVVDDDGEQILRANVHLLPDPSIPTDETGSRHRTAERVAQQTGRPVLSVSEGRSVATVFAKEGKHQLESSTQLLARANQALQTMERFRGRLDEAEERLTRLEMEDLVTFRDVVALLQRNELVRRMGSDIEDYAVELGGEGGLLRLQLADLRQGIDRLRDLVVLDYVRPRRSSSYERALQELEELPTQFVYEPLRVGFTLRIDRLDTQARPQGYRLLERVPRLPESVKDALVDHFQDFQKMLRASPEDLDEVEGVGRARALDLRQYFDRLLDDSRVWSVGDM